MSAPGMILFAVTHHAGRGRPDHEPQPALVLDDDRRLLLLRRRAGRPGRDHAPGPRRCNPCGRLRGAVTIEHYHDLGKLTFGFVFFWGYIAFSQYMLIWYANMPEETQFYMPRQIGPWVGRLAGADRRPFRAAVRRADVASTSKRNLPLHAFWLVWLLAAQRVRPVLADHAQHVHPPDAGPAKAGTLPEAFKTLLASQQSVYQLSPAHQVVHGDA